MSDLGVLLLLASVVPAWFVWGLIGFAAFDALDWATGMPRDSIGSWIIDSPADMWWVTHLIVLLWPLSLVCMVVARFRSRAL